MTRLRASSVSALVLLVSFGERAASQCVAEHELGFSTERISSAAAPAGIVGEVVGELLAGAVGSVDVYANAVSLAGGNVQGWALSIEVGGDIVLREATIDGTAGALVGQGGSRLSISYESTEIALPERNGGRTGAVNGVILSLKKVVVLPNPGTESIFFLAVEAASAQGPEDISGTVAFNDGLRGAGEPTRNFLTVGGQSRFPCTKTPVNVVFRDCRCNTPASQGPVTVRDPAVEEVQVTFSQVTGAGTTTVEKTSCDQENLQGLALVGGAAAICYEIETTATFSGGVDVCVEYDDTGLSPADEAGLIMVACQDPQSPCEELPISRRDLEQNVLCGTTDHFSVFAVARPVVVGSRFLRGACNTDDVVDISDAIFLLGFLFRGGEAPSCPEACDTNEDATTDLSDAVSLLGFLFRGNDPPGLNPACESTTEPCTSSVECP